MKLSRIGIENGWIFVANKKFRKYLGHDYSMLELTDTDRELCGKIVSNFSKLGVLCLLDYSMNIDDKLKIINDCFEQVKTNIP